MTADGVAKARALTDPPGWRGGDEYELALVFSDVDMPSPGMVRVGGKAPYGLDD